MKNIILFLCIFYTLIVKSQCLEKIKKQDSFFILLDKNDKFSEYGCLEKDVNPACNYRFLKKNKDSFEYSFYYHKYPNIDEAYSKINQSTTFRIDKSFLRKNKDIIITRKFMEKQGKQAMLSLLDDDASNKTIFLINTAETKNGKIVLREVKIDYIKEE
tara:strand:+ start:1783 stop:2259 length:477 start_codon:yes stop_codon:yes gene_type:complete